ncbi:hypothetical protein [Undibacterium danionis]|uniref:DUF2187 domain-containing protein n=1 Tax=Undibacterium danionis TaxID=1812100 RepID=A0ABV6IIT5_9BURK
MSQTPILDSKQQTVEIGDIVRVTTLSRQFIKSFPEDERILIESMIGNFFKIIAIDEEGQACIMREWHDERGQLQTHVIALDAEEMEKV